MTKFRAAVLRNADEFAVEELELLPIRENQVLVRVAASEMNMTDAMFSGQLAAGMPGLPQTMGHAICGVVEEIGSAVTRVKVGDRIIANGTAYCGRCWACLNDGASQCEQNGPASKPYARTTDGLDVTSMAHVGGHAELAVLPELQTVVVNGIKASDADLAALASTYGSGAGAALLIAPVTPASTVAVVGLGPTGLAYLQAARFRGAHTIIGIDPLPHRRERAIANGATHVIDSSKEDTVQAVRALTGGAAEGAVFGGEDGYSSSGVQFVFEASADIQGMRDAFLITRPTGHVVFSSLPHAAFDDVSIPATELAVYSRNVHGNQGGGLLVARDFPMMAHLIADGHLNPSALHDLTADLDDIADIRAKVLAHEVVGAIIRSNG